MILDAAIKIRAPGSGTIKAVGDVVMLKPAGSIWSASEKKLFQIISLDTAELKKKDADLTAQVVAVEQAFLSGKTVIANPFSYEDKSDPAAPVMTLRSRVKIDFDLLPKAEADQIKDPMVEVPKLDTAKVKSLIVLKDPLAKPK